MNRCRTQSITLIQQCFLFRSSGEEVLETILFLEPAFMWVQCPSPLPHCPNYNSGTQSHQLGWLGEVSFGNRELNQHTLSLDSSTLNTWLSASLLVRYPMCVSEVKLCTCQLVDQFCCYLLCTFPLKPIPHLTVKEHVSPKRHKVMTTEDFTHKNGRAICNYGHDLWHN